MKVFLSKFKFSQLTRQEKFIPFKQKKIILEKQEKLNQNIHKAVYDGVDFRNTDDISNKKKEIYYPTQHPKLINNEDTNIISYKPPPMNITKYHRIPQDVIEFNPPKFESPLDSKELDIAILGPPNAGKSSLLNRLVNANISTVSNKYGTTIDRIEGIFTDINDKIQLKFTDTPGAIKVSKSL